MIFGELNAALAVIDRITNRLRQKSSKPSESVVSRFIQLFESHGVHRNQIPRFFDHGLTLKDVSDDQSLLIKLNETILDDACLKFGVRREWLDGAEPNVYSCHDFYKKPEDVEKFLTNLISNNPDNRLEGVLLAPSEGDGEVVLVLYEVIGSVGDREIYRYHLCNNWLFDYWKSRAYLTAVVAVAWRFGVCLRGAYVPKTKIEQKFQGESLLFRDSNGDPCFPWKKWYPEDMALNPDEFLRSIDPEKNNFAIGAALKLWLSLEQQGYMNTGLNQYAKADVRQRFERRLSLSGEKA